jgi:nucleotide-binding universal stress UspA family protein
MSLDHAGWSGHHLKLRHHSPPDGAPATELVVALDGSAFAERAIDVADALAAASGLPLRLVAVRSSPADHSATESYLARIARRMSRVTDVAVALADDVAAGLAGELAHGGLLVLATHARRAVGEVLVGSVADRLLATVDRPLLLVGPAAGVPNPDFATIVVPDDGGVRSAALRPSAIAWSEHLGAVLWAVQALPATNTDPDLEVLESAHIRRVAKLLGPSAGWEALHGSDPAADIVAFATERRAGLIAMAVPARHRLGADVGGGVALRVVRHAPCPVLALSPEER